MHEIDSSLHVVYTFTKHLMPCSAEYKVYFAAFLADRIVGVAEAAVVEC